MDEQPDLNQRIWQTSAPDDFRLWEQTSSDFDTHPLLSSATDLLIAWRPQTEDAGNTADAQAAWDRYFQGIAVRPRPEASEIVKLASETPLESWNIDAAESAVDCLFTFLRALETSDINAAMKCVSKHYHVVDGHREILWESLRLDIEKLVDQWRSAEVQITTAEVPDPVHHPAGILIPVTIQIDISPPRLEQKVSQLISCICVFNETDTGQWLLSSIAKIAKI